MMATENEHSYMIKCNKCAELMQGRCFRTACDHFFCERCAYGQFSTCDFCPICQCRITEHQLDETMIGLSTAASLKETLFQTILEDCKWEQILRRTVEINSVVSEVSRFVLGQLQHDAVRAGERAAELERDASGQRQEMRQLTVQFRNQITQLEQRARDVEYKLHLKEKEFSELSEAYKEKMRKCQAWEKAYASIREQLAQNQGFTTNTQYGPPSPMCSPRSGISTSHPALPSPHDQVTAAANTAGSAITSTAFGLMSSRSKSSLPLPPTGPTAVHGKVLRMTPISLGHSAAETNHGMKLSSDSELKKQMQPGGKRFFSRPRFT